MNKIIGIYKIQSLVFPARFYIGSSYDIYKRWRQHLHKLKTHTHENARLQHHADKYGINDLQFTILFSCDFFQLIPLEQAQLNMLKPTFNILKQCRPGSYQPSKLTTRQKISASWKLRQPISMFSRLFRNRHS